MDETSPWREVAAQFSKIRRQGGDQLVANWNPEGWNKQGDPWYLSGIDGARVHENFKWAAERAAVLLGQKPTPSSLFFWLDLLRKESPDYQREKLAEYRNGIEVEVDIGIIRSVCRASEEYCFKLETQYIANAPARRRKEAFVKMIERSQTTVPHDNLALRGQHQILRVEADAEARAQEQVLYEKRLAELRQSEQNKAPELLPPVTFKQESIANQLGRLREECRWTIDQLAEKIQVDRRTVQRHLAADAMPYKRHIAAYERVFYKQLNRKIVIEKMP
jgi:hypothetical protein